MTTALAGLAALALGLTAFGASAPIANSKHNMNLVFGNGTIQNNEVCLPCHSAHSRQPEDMEFLWNHEMPTTEYKTYALSGTNASLNVGDLDEVSKMCLSCHDGTVAVDSYYSTIGAAPGATLVNGTHKLGAGNDALGNSTAGFVVGGGTGDLTHDHPVGIRYPGLSPTTGTWTKGSWRFKDPTKFTSAKYISADQTGAPAGDYNYTNYQKYDAATKTFSNISAVGGGAIGLEKMPGDTYATVIGCAACHTPHTSTYNFLRMPNTNSQLCLTCHDK
jgi:predicted CXXCH cytochrome family protein